MTACTLPPKRWRRVEISAGSAGFLDVMTTSSAGGREQARGTHTNRSGAGGDDHTPSTHIAGCLPQSRHGRRGGRVGSVGIEHHRHAQGPEERFGDRAQQTLADRHVGATHEDGGVVQILGPSREDGAVDQIPHGIFRDAGVTHHLIGAAIEADHAIEHAGM